MGLPEGAHHLAKGRQIKRNLDATTAGWELHMAVAIMLTATQAIEMCPVAVVLDTCKSERKCWCLLSKSMKVAGASIALSVIGSLMSLPAMQL